MKYKYKFDEIVFKDGDKFLIIVMDEEKYRMIAQFLMSDVQGQDPQYIFTAIDNVLSGKSEFEQLIGNVCCVDINRENTQIYDNLAEDRKGEWCEIETKELRKLVETWSNEIKQFNDVQRTQSMSIYLSVTQKLKNFLYKLYSKFEKLFNLRKNNNLVNFKSRKKIFRCTFFPKHWSPQQVVDAINEAFENKQLVDGSKNTFRGQASDGLKIEMYLDRATGKIVSAFPRL